MFWKTSLICLILLISLILEANLFSWWQADQSYGLGKSLDGAGEYAAAYPYLAQAVQANPGEPTFRSELAFNQAVLAAAFAAKNSTQEAQLLTQQAISNSDAVVTQSPNAMPFWKDRTRVFYTLSLTDKKYLAVALESIKKAADLAPTDAKVHYNLGIILDRAGQKTQARQVMAETLKLKPDYSDAQKWLEENRQSN